jgi:hypothetical protein
MKLLVSSTAQKTHPNDIPPVGVATDGTSFLLYVGDVDLFKCTKLVWVSRAADKNK